MRLILILILIVILAVLLCGVVASQAAVSMFESKDAIYKVPIKVNEETTITDFGLKPVFDFAKSQQSTGKWTYAYEATLQKNPQTGKFSVKKNEGEDRFVRFFEGRQAEIIINWSPINGEIVDKTTNLKQNFDIVLKKFGDAYKESGESFDRTATVEAKIGGYPAMDCKFNVSNGSKGYTTIWVVRAEDMKKMFIIRLFYAKGYADPAGDFEKVKKGIVFINQ